MSDIKTIVCECGIETDTFELYNYEIYYCNKCYVKHEMQDIKESLHRSKKDVGEAVGKYFEKVNKKLNKIEKLMELLEKS